MHYLRRIDRHTICRFLLWAWEAFLSAPIDSHITGLVVQSLVVIALLGAARATSLWLTPYWRWIGGAIALFHVVCGVTKLAFSSLRR